jgi:hypothetical protein
VPKAHTRIRIVENIIRTATLTVKSLILILLASTLAVESYAQRALDFANCAPGVNAPITNAAGTRITAPSSFVVDVFYNTNTNAVPNPLGSDSFLAGGFNQAFSSGRPGIFSEVPSPWPSQILSCRSGAGIPATVRLTRRLGMPAVNLDTQAPS